MPANAHVAPPRAQSHTNRRCSKRKDRPPAGASLPGASRGPAARAGDRLHMDDLRRTDPDRLVVDQSRLREIANVDLSVKAETLSR